MQRAAAGIPRIFFSFSLKFTEQSEGKHSLRAT